MIQAIEYLFRFIIQSRLLFVAKHPAGEHLQRCRRPRSFAEISDRPRRGCAIQKRTGRGAHFLQLAHENVETSVQRCSSYGLKGIFSLFTEL